MDYTRAQVTGGHPGILPNTKAMVRKGLLEERIFEGVFVGLIQDFIMK